LEGIKASEGVSSLYLERSPRIGYCEHKIAISKVTGVEPGTRYYLGSMPMETMQDLFNAIFLKGKKITQEKICDALGIKK
jgi:hypothetical protein